MAHNTPASGGRGVRRTTPTTRLDNQVPVDVRAGFSGNQRFDATERHTHIQNDNGERDIGQQTGAFTRRAPSVLTGASSTATRLRENALEAKRKLADLDDQLLEKNYELANIEAALFKSRGRVGFLQACNDDRSRDKEIEDEQMKIIDMTGDVHLLTQTVSSLEKSIARRKEIIIEEKDLNDDIIREDDNGSASDISNGDNQQRVETWVNTVNDGVKNESDAEAGNDDNLPPHHNLPTSGDGNNTVAQLVTALSQAFGHQQQQPTKLVDKDLPSFNGNPEDWLTFKSEYDRTTRKYRYDESENIVRLRKYLRGPARDCINHLLANPKNEKKIISTLQNRFGNPQFVLSTMIDKAKWMKPPDINKPETIVDFGTAVDALVTNIVAFKMDDYLNNIQLLTELVEKLPPALRRDWYKWMSTQKKKEDLAVFQQWLELEVETAIRSVKPKQQIEERKPERFGKRQHGAHSGKEEEACPCCKKDNHQLWNCQAFKKMKQEDRWKVVREVKVCFCCLSANHVSSRCSKSRECGLDGCTKNHHRLLHRPVLENAKPKPVVAPIPEPVGNEEGNVIATAGVGTLPMIYVRLSGPRGTRKVLAMLDIGCTFTAVEEDIARELGLEGERKPFVFSVFGNNKLSEKDSRIVTATISGMQRVPQRYNLKNVKTVSKLGIRSSPLDFEKMRTQYPYLKKAHAMSIPDEKPRMVIGYDNYRLYHSRYTLEGPSEDSPSAYRSRLGWYICGHGASSSCYFGADEIDCEDKKMHEEMKHFFAIENSGVRQVQLARSKEDVRALALLEKYTRKVDGSWETCLLWRDDNPTLPESKLMAMKRYQTMERKMSKDSSFADLVHNKFGDYLEKGYLVPADSFKRQLEPSSKKWYLPWFFSYHPTKKPRLVYDAAAKSNGKSLNDFLLKGPDMLNPLPTVLMRFREKKVALTGDIKEMFHQVKLMKEDWPAQTILYRGPNEDSPKEYYMTVLFFGAACSPCSAIFAKRRNAEEFSEMYPKAVAAIHDNFYMDDFLYSCDTEGEAIQMRKEITEIHKHGGFQVVKWSSNSSLVMKSIPDEMRAESNTQLSSKGEVHLDKTLGLWWNPETDDFHFLVNMDKIPAAVRNKERRPTKREVTSVVMSLFDPLGFLSPIKVKALMIIQNIWKSGISWDDEITALLDGQWTEWLKELESVKSVKIRRIMASQPYSKVDLHVYVDAAEEAYSCSLYFRFEGIGQVEQCFVVGKARVAPIKGMTIPRMELEAALIGARLANNVQSALGRTVNINSTTFWSDSKTVLCWLRSQTGRFKMHVQTRVGEIQELSDVNQWRWVPTALNVADDATRFTKSENFSSESRWLKGVDFLLQHSSLWPKEENKKDVNISDLEIKNAVFLGVAETDFLPDLSRFSSWIRLIRATATVFKAIRRLTGQKASQITVPDMKLAERLWIARSQEESFPTELEKLKNGQSVGKNSRLSQFSVKLDKFGVIVLDGRVNALPDDGITSKNPPVLDPNHRYANLWLHWLHVQGGHQGQERIMSESRKTAWILDCRSAVRRSWALCHICKMRKLKPPQPMMGQIPLCRLAESKQPFYHTGVDLFGPLHIKVNRSLQKRWGVIFTCMTTRAVHLDVVESLETGEAINALARFIAFRGPPSHIWSDNGTNFVGANRELKKAVLEWNQEHLQESLATKGIQWHFNPPAAPHMGGSWERLVGVAKKIMMSLLKSQAPRESVLRTVLAQVMDIMNSRPLTYASPDPADEECLTPNHFLKMKNVDGPPLPGIFLESDKYRRMWRYTQHLADEFWRRWKTEYLHTLVRREKWIRSATPLKEGDLVFVVDDLIPRAAWKKGLIVGTFPGPDGHTRVVDVRVAVGKPKGKEKITFHVLRRPVVKVIPLGLTAFVTGGHWEGENVPASPSSLVRSGGKGDCNEGIASVSTPPEK